MDFDDYIKNIRFAVRTPFHSDIELINQHYEVYRAEMLDKHFKPMNTSDLHLYVCESYNIENSSAVFKGETYSIIDVAQMRFLMELNFFVMNRRIDYLLHAYYGIRNYTSIVRNDYFLEHHYSEMACDIEKDIIESDELELSTRQDLYELLCIQIDFAILHETSHYMLDINNPSRTIDMSKQNDFMLIVINAMDRTREMVRNITNRNDRHIFEELLHPTDTLYQECICDCSTLYHMTHLSQNLNGYYRPDMAILGVLLYLKHTNIITQAKYLTVIELRQALSRYYAELRYYVALEFLNDLYKANPELPHPDHFEGILYEYEAAFNEILHLVMGEDYSMLKELNDDNSKISNLRNTFDKIIGSDIKTTRLIPKDPLFPIA